VKNSRNILDKLKKGEVKMEYKDEKESSTITLKRLKRNKVSLYNSHITPPWSEKSIDIETQKSVCDICKKYEKALNIGSCEIVMGGTERFEKEYAEIWYENIASKKEKEYIHQIKIRYILLALIGILPFHRWYLWEPDFEISTYVRTMFAIFIFPLFISWYEALSTLVGTDKDFFVDAGGYKKVLSNAEIMNVYVWWVVNVKNKQREECV
jgi:glutaredoxin